MFAGTSGELAMSSSPELDALVIGANHLLVGKYFQLAAFVMLVYDHILTFSQEVDRIWNQRFSAATLLFLLNRYVTPLQFLIILDAFHDPRWTKQACDKFVAFEGASTVALIGVCELIMILRVFALYGRSFSILFSLLALWAAQIGISAFGLSTGFAVPLPPMLTGCIFTGASALFPSLWVAPLVMDSCIFILTLWRTRRYLQSAGVTPTLHIFVRDGALYFFVIFLANLMNTLIFFLSPPDLKAVGASFSQLITAVMVSRLVLNLRLPANSHHEISVKNSFGRPKLYTDSLMTRTIGNLGGNFDTSTDESHIYTKEYQIPMSSMSRGRGDTPSAI